MTAGAADSADKVLGAVIGSDKKRHRDRRKAKAKVVFRLSYLLF